MQVARQNGRTRKQLGMNRAWTAIFRQTSSPSGFWSAGRVEIWVAQQRRSVHDALITKARACVRMGPPGCKLGLAPLIFLLLASQSPSADLEVDINGVRNSRGLLRLCLTQKPQHFPDCSADRHAIRLSFPASQASVKINGLSPGSYALAIIHDENGNGRLDSFLSVPKEGFGFSGEHMPAFAPPSFDQAHFALKAGVAKRSVRMRYLL